MISIIDRYISKIFALYFVAGLLVFVTIFLAVDFMGAFARYEVGTDVLVRYYGYYLPAVVYQMVPVGCLVATVFTLSTLNKSHELIALFSVGMSLGRVSAPILSAIALISVLSFWLGDRVLPNFAQKRNYIYYVEIKKKPGLYSTVKKNRIWYRSENILFNLKSLSPTKNKAQGITLYYFDEDWKLVQLIKSKNVSMDGSTWNLSKGNLTLFSGESDFPMTQTFEKKKIQMNEDMADLKESAASGEVMSVKQLNRFIERNKEAGLDTLRYEVDFHGKYAFALAAFVMSMIGIPFSVAQERSGGAFKNVGICMGLAFLYWLTYSSSLTMGKHGLLPPILSAWGPNLLGLGSSIYLLLRMKK